MAIVEKRINTRDKRLLVEDVFGVNPFDKIKSIAGGIDDKILKIKQFESDIRSQVDRVNDLIETPELVLDSIGVSLLNDLSNALLGKPLTKHITDLENILGSNAKDILQNQLGMSSSTLETLNDEINDLIEYGPIKLILDELNNNATIRSPLGQSLLEILKDYNYQNAQTIVTNTLTPQTTPTSVLNTKVPEIDRDAIIAEEGEDFIITANLDEPITVRAPDGDYFTIEDDEVYIDAVDQSYPSLPSPNNSPIVSLDFPTKIASVAAVCSSSSHKPELVSTIFEAISPTLANNIAEVTTAIGIDNKDIATILTGITYGDGTKQAIDMPNLVDTILDSQAPIEDIADVVDVLDQQVTDWWKYNLPLPDITESQLVNNTIPTTAYKPLNIKDISLENDALSSIGDLSPWPTVPLSMQHTLTEILPDIPVSDSNSLYPPQLTPRQVYKAISYTDKAAVTRPYTTPMSLLETYLGKDI